MKIAYKIIYPTSIALLSVAVFLGVSYLGSFSFLLKQIIGIITYFFLTYLILSDRIVGTRLSKLFIIITPVLLAIIFINIVNFETAWLSLPSNVFLLISSCTAYFFKGKRILAPLLGLYLVFAAWQSLGMEKLINKMHYGSATKIVDNEIANLHLYDSAKNVISIGNNEKYYILDFWNSRCAPCYGLFPTIDSINKINDRSRFEIAVVNIPFFDETIESNRSLLQKYSYSFTEFFMTNDSALSSLKIKVFPTTIVVKAGKVIYRGDFLSAIELIKGL